jgi:hypothetical protein
MAKTRRKTNATPQVYSLYYCIEHEWVWRASSFNKDFLRGIAVGDGKSDGAPASKPYDPDAYVEAADFVDGTNDGHYAIAEFGTLDGQTC